ncbi:MAG TPA: hypothetical protein VJJ27_01070 [Candidatus Paceibacterota bacterium]
MPPETVADQTTGWPTTPGEGFGEQETENEEGGLTVNWNWVVRVGPSVAVPVTVTVKVPVEAVGETVRVIVELHVAAQGLLEIAAETPEGRPETDNETGFWVPEIAVRVMSSVAKTSLELFMTDTGPPFDKE